MVERKQETQPTDLVDSLLVGTEAEDWLAAHPELVDEVEIARRVRSLIAELRAAEIQVPADFEARMMERVRGDAAMLSLLDLWFSGLGVALLELLDAFFALLPQPQQAPA
ncbi:MAG: hypothetical protein ACREA9_27750 [Pyrinomonadaceae bacterium]